jgi:hypothetical protein
MPRYRKTVLPVLLAAIFSLLLPSFGIRAQTIHFERITSNISDDTLTLSHREEARIEHFLRRVYPKHSMERKVRPIASPLLQKARYDVVELQGMRYIVAGYVAEFAGDQFVHDIAIYRMEPQGPNQVWRSKPWIANYYGLNFESIKAGLKRAGSKMLLLFKEGGLDPTGFSISSIFSFSEGDSSFLLYNLTPKMPHLQAKANFPHRVLYGQKVNLEKSDDGSVILAASDDKFDENNEQAEPKSFWKFNPKRGRFLPIKSPIPDATMTLK